MKIYFPSRFATGQDVEFFAKLKTLVEIELKQIIDPELVVKMKGLYKAIKDYFYNLSTPRLFGLTRYSVIVELENSFENLCAMLEDLGATKVKEMTIFEYYTRIDYYEKKFTKKGQE